MIEPFILLLIILSLNSIAIFGVNVATDFDWKSEDHKELGVEEKSKMIGWKLRYWSLKYLGEFYSKPLFTCPPCMSSVHSTYFYIFFLSFVSFDVKWMMYYPLYVFSLAGLNYMVGKKIA